MIWSAQVSLLGREQTSRGKMEGQIEDIQGTHRDKLFGWCTLPVGTPCAVPLESTASNTGPWQPCQSHKEL